MSTAATGQAKGGPLAAAHVPADVFIQCRESLAHPDGAPHPGSQALRGRHNGNQRRQADEGCEEWA